METLGFLHRFFLNAYKVIWGPFNSVILFLKCEVDSLILSIAWPGALKDLGDPIMKWIMEQWSQEVVQMSSAGNKGGHGRGPA